MRTLALIGTLLFIAGTFLVTRATGWHHFGYIISGSGVGLLGLLILGLTASNAQETNAPTRNTRSKPKNRLRRRSTTGIRSLRMRRAGAAGGR